MRLYVLRRSEPTGGFTFRFFWAADSAGALAMWAANVEGGPPTHCAVHYGSDSERPVPALVLTTKSFMPLG